MMRLLRGRWFWGLAGALATVYFLRRSQGRKPYANAGLGMITSTNAMRFGRNAWDTAVRAGRTVAESTARAVARRN